MFSREYWTREYWTRERLTYENIGHELIGVAKGIVQVCLERGLNFDRNANGKPSSCKQSSHVNKCAVSKKTAIKEYEESKQYKVIDPERYKLASVILMSIPDLSTVAYQANCIECNCCTCILRREADFLEQRSGIEEAYEKYNQEHNTSHRCLFLPKFHPELYYIERIWGRLKYYIRLHCDNKFDTMVHNITAAMGTQNLPLAMIRRFARTSFAYLIAYRNGKDIITAHEWIEHRADRSHSERMDASIDQYARSDANADLEKLDFPFGRATTSSQSTNCGNMEFPEIGIEEEDQGGLLVDNLTEALQDNLTGYLLDEIEDDNLDDLFDSDDEASTVTLHE